MRIKTPQHSCCGELIYDSKISSLPLWRFKYWRMVSQGSPAEPSH